MRLRSLAASVCALALVIPAAASAQRGGGHGGGGFHGGAGFHGGYGGYRGGFYRGGFYRGGYGRFGYGFYPYYGFGLGFGLASLYAYDFYSPWYYYYPASFGYGYDGYGGYGGYGYDGYAGDAPPPPGGDAWSQESAAQKQVTSAAASSSVPCGRYVWNAAQSRYHWDDSGC